MDILLIKLPKDLSNICLSYLNNNELTYYFNKWNEFSEYEICNIASKNNWFDLVKWANVNNYICYWSTQTCFNAITNGNLDMLKYILINGDLDGYDYLQECAAEEGQLEIMKWLDEYGYKIVSHKICAAAAYDGHLHIIKWIIQSGYMWNESVCESALKGDQKEIIEWLKLNGCKCKGKYHLGYNQYKNKKLND